MAHLPDRRSTLPMLPLEDRYVGRFIDDGVFAIQEVENPHGWMVSDVSMPVEE